MSRRHHKRPALYPVTSPIVIGCLEQLARVIHAPWSYNRPTQCVISVFTQTVIICTWSRSWRAASVAASAAASCSAWPGAAAAASRTVRSSASLPLSSTCARACSREPPAYQPAFSLPCSLPSCPSGLQMPLPARVLDPAPAPPSSTRTRLSGGSDRSEVLSS
jgi:hypothetical protein